MPTTYPIVPGHEIVGRVNTIGSAVTKYKPGGLAAVGCLVDSDGDCPSCKAGLRRCLPFLGRPEPVRHSAAMGRQPFE